MNLVSWLAPPPPPPLLKWSFHLFPPPLLLLLLGVGLLLFPPLFDLALSWNSKASMDLTLGRGETLLSPSEEELEWLAGRWRPLRRERKWGLHKRDVVGKNYQG